VTAIDFEAIAAWVRLVITAATWAWRAPRKIRGRRKRQALACERRQRDTVLSVATSACAVTAVTLALTAILILAKRAG
jgi:hypothetical protein